MSEEYCLRNRETIPDPEKTSKAESLSFPVRVRTVSTPVPMKSSKARLFPM